MGVGDNLYSGSFPQQKLTLAQKDEQWQHKCVDYIIGEGSFGTSGRRDTQHGEMQTYYNLYNSIFDEKDFKRITNPFKVDDGFPATPQDFNIIRPKIDLLIGEETKRPLNFRVIRTSQEAVSELQDKEKEMLMQYMMAAIQSKMGPEEQQQFQQQLQSGEIMPPEAIAKYMDKEYKDIVENTAYHTLEYLKEKLSLNNEFIKGWKDGLISGTEVYYVGIQNGEPYAERVNPMDFDHDHSPDIEFIEDGSWCVRKMRLPLAEVYDRYSDKIDEKSLNKLNELLSGVPYGNMPDKSPVDDFNHITTHIYDKDGLSLSNKHNIEVWHVCWKSFKKIFYVTTIDESGEPQVTICDETYKKVGTEVSIEPDWIIEVWEGYRAGKDLYFGVKPLEYQHVSIDNPNSQKLPYCGCIYSATNSRPRSLVSILKPLQYMYIVLWYRLELAIARDKGKVINMDITQIPKSMNITPDRWMHYLSSVGVNFINPYECFDPNTKVIMADGTIKRIKDIAIGEYVMGTDGKARKVLSTHSGIDNMYKIHAGDDFDDQIVNSVHKIYYKYKDSSKNISETRLSTPIQILEEIKNNPNANQNFYLQKTDLNYQTNKKIEQTLSHFTVSYNGIGEYCGITIDGDNLFLLKDFTIVHNCGWNIPGREGGKPASFNQITSLDLTMSQVISEYIQLMDKIEQLAGTISGITTQREGAISSSELVGNVERSVIQSSHITEPLFWVHNQCKRHVMTMLLNTAKGAWESTGKQKLSYVFDNGERAFIDIAKKFYYEDMDVFVSDASKDIENIQKLQQLIQPAMQNGASLLEAAEILTNDNFNILKQKLKDMQTRQEQLQQQQQEAEAQQQQQLQQMQNESKQQELMLEEAKMDLERYKIDADNQTKIAVAEISAYRGTEDKDANMNGIPDPMEIAKDATEQRKIDQEAYLKRYEARQKREIEDAKISLEKTRMDHEMALQKQKDDAALQREKIKASTALKNKVTGEN